MRCVDLASLGLVMTTDEFNAGMARLCAATGKAKTDDLYQTYWDSVSRMEASVFAETVTKLVESQDRFPTIPQIWAVAKASRRRSSEDLYFSFLCDRCGLPFSVRQDEMNVAHWFDCTSCDFYYHKKVRWNGAFLRKQMDLATAEGSNLAILKPADISLELT